MRIVIALMWPVGAFAAWMMWRLLWSAVEQAGLRGNARADALADELINKNRATFCKGMERDDEAKRMAAAVKRHKVALQALQERQIEQPERMRRLKVV